MVIAAMKLKDAPWKESYDQPAAAAAAAKSIQSCPTLCDPIDGSPPGSPSLGFSRQGHWSGLPFPSSGDPPNPGIEPRSLKEQASFNFMAGITICSDFGAPKNKV